MPQSSYIQGVNRTILPLLTVGLLLLLAACRTTHEFSEAQLACLEAAPTAVRSAAAGGTRFTGDILVSYQSTPGLMPAALQTQLRQLQAQGVATSHGLTVLAQGDSVLPDLVRPLTDQASVLAALRADPRVDWAFPDFELQLLDTIDCSTEQWNLADFGVPEAWGRGPGSHEVVVAVIDSGIDVDHPELREAMLPGFNFDQMTDDPRPGEPQHDNHGTHVAGIIAARGDQLTGVAGFPAQVRILPIRIFDDRGDAANFSDLLRALSWAAGNEVSGTPQNPHPARIINLSLGAQLPPFAELNKAVTEVVGEGIIVIAASGNAGEGVTDPSSGIFTPANTDAALAIGSADRDFTRSAFSMFGGPKALTVLAPGGSGPSRCGSVLSTVPGEAYGCLSGTSMAAPFVTGAVALLLTHEPDLQPHQIEARLRAATHWDLAFMTGVQYGSGVLCANRLLSGINPDPGQRC